VDSGREGGRESEGGKGRDEEVRGKEGGVGKERKRETKRKGKAREEATREPPQNK